MWVGWLRIAHDDGRPLRWECATLAVPSMETARTLVWRACPPEEREWASVLILPAHESPYRVVRPTP